MDKSQTAQASPSNPKELNKVHLISEIGINSNGSLQTATEQILRSKAAGADSVKFQVYKTSELFDKSFEYYEDSLRGMFSVEDHRFLAKFSKENGIEYFASPFHLWAVDFLESVDVKRYKIASRSVSDLKLLNLVAQTKKPVIMSTGMSKPDDIKRAMDILKDSDVTLLYCVCKYPTDPGDFNFGQMFRLYQDFKGKVGFSSHCPEIWPSVKAVALGATVVEQHTTISRSMPGVDQAASLEYDELAELNRVIRGLERVG